MMQSDCTVAEDLHCDGLHAAELIVGSYYVKGLDCTQPFVVAASFIWEWV